MRVLLLHNRYRQPGGEERAVSEIGSLLERRGHDVRILERRSARASSARAAGALLAGGLDPGAVVAAVRAHGAEVVHAHNLQPLLGARALEAARAQGARTVLHLHNFRLVCAISVAYRDGEVCHSCKGRNTLPGVVHRCRGSLGEAVAYAAGLSLNQRSIVGAADALVSLSTAHRNRLVALGIPGERVSVVPNVVSNWAASSSADAGTYALAAGRLTEEKGFDTAIAAARQARVPLVIAGTGPDEARLRSLTAGAEVRFTGWLSSSALADLRNGAGVTLVPSRWEEVCPYAVLESIAAGVPVLASDLGGLPELVGRERALPARDVTRWAQALGELMGDPARRRSCGEAALKDGRSRFGEEAVYAALMRLYEGGGSRS